MLLLSLFHNLQLARAENRNFEFRRIYFAYMRIKSVPAYKSVITVIFSKYTRAIQTTELSVSWSSIYPYYVNYTHTYTQKLLVEIN